MNEDTAVMDAPLDTNVETLEQLDAVMVEEPSPEVMVIEMEQSAEVPEIMELPENVNPNLVDEIAAIDPEEHDIAEELGQMDTFQEFEREIFREMRGMTSDYL
jgi:hypothetical protein